MKKPVDSWPARQLIPNDEKTEAYPSVDDGTRFWRIIKDRYHQEVFAESFPSLVAATFYFTASEALFKLGYGRDESNHPRNPLRRLLKCANVVDPYACCAPKLAGTVNKLKAEYPSAVVYWWKMTPEQRLEEAWLSTSAEARSEST